VKNFRSIDMKQHVIVYKHHESGNRGTSKPTIRNVVPDVSLSFSFKQDWVWALILFLAVMLTYTPIWQAGFVWDDEVNITHNPCIVGPLGLKEIWTTSAGQFFPLVLTTFWVEHELWGLAPLPYHLVSVLLHAACAVSLWRVLQSLQIPGSWLGAALWALHPLQVESVAWISEMKNTQSGLFYLLTILFFVKYLRTKDLGREVDVNWNYALTLIFAALAMMSKASTVVLPIVLCLCAWWVEGQWRWHNLVKLTPVFTMSIVDAGLSLWSYRSGVRVSYDPQWTETWPQRIATVGDVIWFYLGKLLWPHPLMTVYPRWQINAGLGISYLPLLAVIAILLFLWFKRTSWWGRSFFFAFSYFLIGLSLFLTLIDQSFWQFSFVEDHLQFLAGMGPLAMVGMSLALFSNVILPERRWLQGFFGAVLLLVLGLWSWKRAWVYQSDETLWGDALAKNPNCWVAYSNIGTVFAQRGQIHQAMAYYQKALEINPNYADAHNNFGAMLAQNGRLDEAMSQYRKAIDINPDHADAHNNLGALFMQQGKVDEALIQYKKALQINSNYIDAYNNLGLAFVKKGQLNEAIAQYQNALKVDPGNADVHNNLGATFIQKGQLDKAIAQYQEALNINPEYVDAYNNLGLAFVEKGQMDEARIRFELAVELNSNNAEAHNNLGNVYYKMGRLDESIIHFKKALELNPSNADAHYNLGSALSKKGQVNEAIAEFQKALKIDPNNAEAHNNLGDAFLHKGQINEAIVQFRKALTINSKYVEAYSNLGVAFFQKGQLDEAITQFQEALRLKSDFIQAQDDLAEVRVEAQNRLKQK